MIATAAPACPPPSPGAAVNLDKVLYAAISETFGYSWRHRNGCDDIPTELRECCRYLREFYSDRGIPDYDRYGMSASAAYALGYFPQIYFKAQNVLSSSAPDITKWPAHTRILDLGAGPGTMSLAILGALACQSPDDTRVCSFTLVDRVGTMTDLANRMLSCYASGTTLMPGVLDCAHPTWVVQSDFYQSETIEQVAADGPYHFVAFGNCLCEDNGLKSPPTIWAQMAVPMVKKYAALVADGGYLFVMEPKLPALVKGVATLRDSFQNEPGWTVAAWSSCERLPAGQRDAPEIAREVLGEDTIRSWKNGSPSTFLLLRKGPAV